MLHAPSRQHLRRARRELRSVNYGRMTRRLSASPCHCVAVAVAMAVIAVIFTHNPTGAQTLSPSIAPSKMHVNHPLRQGQELALPPLSVGMPGDAAASIEIDILHIGDQPELVPNRSWFRFNPERFDTQPTRTTVVEARMSVPKEAAPGTYKVLLRARQIRDSSATVSGVGVTGAVASTLTFTVVNVDFKPWDPAVDFFRERAPFSYV